eukprot:57477_1
MQKIMHPNQSNNDNQGNRSRKRARSLDELDNHDEPPNKKQKLTNNEEIPKQTNICTDSDELFLVIKQWPLRRLQQLRNLYKYEEKICDKIMDLLIDIHPCICAPVSKYKLAQNTETITKLISKLKTNFISEHFWENSRDVIHELAGIPQLSDCITHLISL